MSSRRTWVSVSRASIKVALKAPTTALRQRPLDGLKCCAMVFPSAIISCGLYDTKHKYVRVRRIILR
jgi:hypothetical protein